MEYINKCFDSFLDKSCLNLAGWQSKILAEDLKSSREPILGKNMYVCMYVQRLTGKTFYR
jgi:hypothetical protein